MCVCVCACGPVRTRALVCVCLRVRVRMCALVSAVIDHAHAQTDMYNTVRKAQRFSLKNLMESKRTRAAKVIQRYIRAFNARFCT